MRTNLRTSFLVMGTAMLALFLGPITLRAQAAAEYTMGASKAATGAAGFGNIMNRGLSKAGNKISEKLSEQMKTPIHESPALVMKENRAVLEKLAGANGGTLRFTSDPSDATVLVDGKLVGRTPAEIQVPAGKHTIVMGRPDRDQWSKQVTVAKEQTLDVHAKLVNSNPSVITLDFRDPGK